MSDAAQIAREAKSLQVGLKELLKTHDVLDKEIEIQRKNLRRLYLRLLFVHPYAKESRDAETHLWMQTSYSLISIYKQRIASLDRAIQNPPRQPQQNAQPQRVVEYRKLLQRFRQFLAEEERFWTQLIVRFRRNFSVDSAEHVLNTLGILPEEEGPPAGTDGTASNTRKNQYQFPPESDTPEATPQATTASQRESRLAILSKALVCLGDIARYKEQYNEAGGRPRAGHEDGPPAVAAGKNSRGRRGGAPPAATPMLLPRMRDYSRARSCYEQARSLVPHDGNPSHQLAILCSYEKDMFNSLAHYYRALCVRSPYDTASENMGTLLTRQLEQWKARRAKREDSQVEASPLPPRLLVEAIKEKVIVLHAQWRLDVNDDEGLAAKILEDFENLVSERVLPLDMISKVIILSQGALWKHRMVRQPSNGEKKARSPLTESRIATHLLDLHRVLLNIASRELSVPPEDAAQGGLAQRITAVFRRTIPALRMAGKWIRANTRYLSQAAGVMPESTRSRGRGRDGKQMSHKDKSNGASPVTIVGLEIFWHDYVKFINMLAKTFPLDGPEKVPKMTGPLEEDVEMVGFLPLRKYMIVEGKLPTSPGERESKASMYGQPPLADATLGRHPNDEQLMRISDMLADAYAVAEDENTPVVVNQGVLEYRKQTVTTGSNGVHVVTDHPSKAIPLAGGAQVLSLGQVDDTDDDNMTVATRTDDDVVGDAVRHVLGQFEAGDDDDDDYEEIVLDLTPMRSPLHGRNNTNDLMTPPRLSPTSSKSPTSPPYSPQRVKPISPPHTLERKIALPTMAAASPPSNGITAAQLLDNIKGSQRLPPPPSTFSHMRMASAPTAPLSFGPNGLTQSIWSDDHTRQYTTGATKSPTSLLPGSPFVSTNSHLPQQNSSIGYGQGPWPNTPTTQAPGNAFMHSSPTSAFSSQPLSSPYNSVSAQNLTGGHIRAPSESVFLPRSQLFPSQPVSHRYDPMRSTLPVGDQVNVPPRGNTNNLPPSAYVDTIYSASPSASSFAHAQSGTHITRDQFGQALPSRGLNGDSRTFTAPFMASSSIWGHPG